MEWIKCSDRMPEEHQSVLGFIQNRPQVMILRFSADAEDDYWFSDEYDDVFPKSDITHWMPLPLSPKP